METKPPLAKLSTKPPVTTADESALRQKQKQKTVTQLGLLGEKIHQKIMQHSKSSQPKRQLQLQKQHGDVSLSKSKESKLNKGISSADGDADANHYLGMAPNMSSEQVMLARASSGGASQPQADAKKPKLEEVQKSLSKEKQDQKTASVLMNSQRYQLPSARKGQSMGGARVAIENQMAQSQVHLNSSRKVVDQREFDCLLSVADNISDIDDSKFTNRTSQNPSALLKMRLEPTMLRHESINAAQLQIAPSNENTLLYDKSKPKILQSAIEQILVRDSQVQQKTKVVGSLPSDKLKQQIALEESPSGGYQFDRKSLLRDAKLRKVRTLRQSERETAEQILRGSIELQATDQYPATLVASMDSVSVLHPESSPGSRPKSFTRTQPIVTIGGQVGGDEYVQNCISSVNSTRSKYMISQNEQLAVQEQKRVQSANLHSRAARILKSINLNQNNTAANDLRHLQTNHLAATSGSHYPPQSSLPVDSQQQRVGQSPASMSVKMGRLPHNYTIDFDTLASYSSKEKVNLRQRLTKSGRPMSSALRNTQSKSQKHRSQPVMVEQMVAETIKFGLKQQQFQTVEHLDGVQLDNDSVANEHYKFRRNDASQNDSGPIKHEIGTASDNKGLQRRQVQKFNLDKQTQDSNIHSYQHQQDPEVLLKRNLTTGTSHVDESTFDKLLNKSKYDSRQNIVLAKNPFIIRKDTFNNNHFHFDTLKQVCEVISKHQTSDMMSLAHLQTALPNEASSMLSSPAQPDQQSKLQLGGITLQQDSTKTALFGFLGHLNIQQRKGSATVRDGETASKIFRQVGLSSPLQKSDGKHKTTREFCEQKSGMKLNQTQIRQRLQNQNKKRRIEASWARPSISTKVGPSPPLSGGNIIEAAIDSRIVSSSKDSPEHRVDIKTQDIASYDSKTCKLRLSDVLDTFPHEKTTIDMRQIYRSLESHKSTYQGSINQNELGQQILAIKPNSATLAPPIALHNFKRQYQQVEDLTDSHKTEGFMRDQTTRQPVDGSSKEDHPTAKKHEYSDYGQIRNTLLGSSVELGPETRPRSQKRLSEIESMRQSYDRVVNMTTSNPQQVQPVQQIHIAIEGKMTSFIRDSQSSVSNTRDYAGRETLRKTQMISEAPDDGVTGSQPLSHRFGSSTIRNNNTSQRMQQQASVFKQKRGRCQSAVPKNISRSGKLLSNASQSQVALQIKGVPISSRELQSAKRSNSSKVPFSLNKEKMKTKNRPEEGRALPQTYAKHDFNLPKRNQLQKKKAQMTLRQKNAQFSPENFATQLEILAEEEGPELDQLIKKSTGSSQQKKANFKQAIQPKGEIQPLLQIISPNITSLVDGSITGGPAKAAQNSDTVLQRLGAFSSDTKTVLKQDDYPPPHPITKPPSGRQLKDIVITAIERHKDQPTDLTYSENSEIHPAPSANQKITTVRLSYPGSSVDDIVFRPISAKADDVSEIVTAEKHPSQLPTPKRQKADSFRGKRNTEQVNGGNSNPHDSVGFHLRGCNSSQKIEKNTESQSELISPQSQIGQVYKKTHLTIFQCSRPPNDKIQQKKTNQKQKKKVSKVPPSLALTNFNSHILFNPEKDNTATAAKPGRHTRIQSPHLFRRNKRPSFNVAERQKMRQTAIVPIQQAAASPQTCGYSALLQDDPSLFASPQAPTQFLISAFEHSAPAHHQPAPIITSGLPRQQALFSPSEQQLVIEQLKELPIELTQQILASRHETLATQSGSEGEAQGEIQRQDQASQIKIVGHKGLKKHRKGLSLVTYPKSFLEGQRHKVESLTIGSKKIKTKKFRNLNKVGPQAKRKVKTTRNVGVWHHDTNLDYRRFCEPSLEVVNSQAMIMEQRRIQTKLEALVEQNHSEQDLYQKLASTALTIKKNESRWQKSSISPSSQSIRLGITTMMGQRSMHETARRASYNDIQTSTGLNPALVKQSDLANLNELSNKLSDETSLMNKDIETVHSGLVHSGLVHSGLRLFQHNQDQQAGRGLQSHKDLKQQNEVSFKPAKKIMGGHSYGKIERYVALKQDDFSTVPAIDNASLKPASNQLTSNQPTSNHSSTNNRRKIMTRQGSAKQAMQPTLIIRHSSEREGAFAAQANQTTYTVINNANQVLIGTIPIDEDLNNMMQHSCSSEKFNALDDKDDTSNDRGAI